MNKLLSFLFLLAFVTLPATASAQITIPQGGTGLNAISNGSIPFKQTGTLRLATSSALQFDASLSKFTTTNASITALTVGSVTATSGTSTLPLLSVQTALNFFGTFATALSDLCVAITGGAGLCDGTDATGTGGTGLATSTAIADTYMIYGTAPGTVGAEAAFTYDDGLDKLTAVNASTTNISATTIWGGLTGNVTGTASGNDILGQATSTLTSHTTTYDHTSYQTAANVYSIVGATTTLANLTITSAQVSDLTANVNAYIHASTTIPKTYTANTYTALQTFATARATALGLGKAASASIALDILTDGTYTQGARVEGDVNTRLGFSGFVTGDAQVRYTQRVDGFMGWGDGTNVTDTSLYRSAANTLKTDDAFVADNITVSSTTASSSLQWVTATAFGIAGKFFADVNQFWVNLATRFLAAVTFDGAVTFFGDMAVGTSTDPTISLTNNFEINTTAASSSLRYFDGTAERVLSPIVERSFNFASSTLAYMGSYGASGTTTILLMNSDRPITVTDIYCKTNTGTTTLAFSDGTNYTDFLVCGPNGTEDDGTIANNTWTRREDFKISIGTATGTPSNITVTAGIRNDAD